MSVTGPFRPVTLPDKRAVRQTRYASSDRGQQTQNRYNGSTKGRDRNTRKHIADYLSRPFVAWDGEGVTVPSGEHKYVLLANSEGSHAVNPTGLSTTETLEFVWSQCRESDPNAIHVVYGASYDFNMWFSDLTRQQVWALYHRDYATVNGYMMQWRRGKSLWLKPVGYEGKGVTIFDVVSFFQCSFVKACDSYLGDGFTHRDMIVKNKALRSTFAMEDLPEVLEYNRYELENLVHLMTELRQRLNAAELRPSRWDGPGAIASALLSSKGIKKCMRESPEPVQEAARYAYAGGRFEIIQYGIGTQPVYEYDINSAYPRALCNVPDLSRGTWHHRQNPPAPPDDTLFCLYHVRFAGGDYRLPQPLFYRAVDGSVLYPGDGTFTGWYWTPDVIAALEYAKVEPRAKVELLESWEYRPANPAARPFHWIPAMYDKRQKLKAAGDGAHVGYKLALNSLYGKTAQQVGAKILNGEWRLPPFHQLEWAGYVTSWCRSKVYRAALCNLSSVVAFETDAVFTTERLPLETGTELGQWEAKEFPSLTYIQSGTYFADSVSKTRGVNAGSLTRDNVEAAIRESKATVTAPLTSFITAGLALQGRWKEWRRWITTEKQVRLYPSGKRLPLPEHIEGFNRSLAARVPDGSHSHAFPVLWANPDPNMDKLVELRESNAEEIANA